MPKATAKQRRDAREVVLKRDGNTCQRCGVDLVYKLASIHHRRPRGMGSSRLVDTPSNLVLLCGSATTPKSCHQTVESLRDEARVEGWLIPKLSRVHPSQVPLLTHRGWLLLADDGSSTPYEFPKEA